MAAFRPAGRTVYEIHVPTRTGTSVKRSTGTRHAGTARAMHALVREIGPRGRRRWALLDAITANPARLTLAQVYDAHHAGGWAGLDALEAQLSDVDLSPLVEAWYAEQASRLRSSWTSIARTRVRTLIPEGTPFLRSALTSARIADWLTGLTVGPTTRSHYRTSLRAFVTWLTARGVLEVDPMAGVGKYRVAAGRMVFLEPDAERAFVAALPGEWRAFGALLHAGAELGAALAMRARDLAEHDGRITARAPGTKAHNRDRVLYLDTWQTAIVRARWEILKNEGWAGRTFLAPDGPTPLAREQAAGAAWRKTVKRTAALGVPAGYRMHDARHTYAVNALRDGLTIEAVARQLGHRDGRLVLERYGRFVVRASDYERRSRAVSRTNSADETPVDSV